MTPKQPSDEGSKPGEAKKKLPKSKELKNTTLQSKVVGGQAGKGGTYSAYRTCCVDDGCDQTAGCPGRK